jgi:transmembrane sensor
MEGFNDSGINYELLGRYLGGECSLDECRLVEDWLNASPENPKILDALQEIWVQSAASYAVEAVDVDAAWQRVQAHVEDEKRIEVRRQIRRSPTMWFIRIAAAVLFVVSIGSVFVLNHYSRLPETELVALKTNDLSLTDTLPDGTVVTLNAHSRLEYPMKFAGKERQVKLEGEAFFDVAHDTAHPFRIHAGAAEVRVLGTSFNLRVRDDDVKVDVQTGTVELCAADSLADQPRQRILLKAGTAGSYDVKSKVLKKEQGEVENALFWKTKTLVFRNQPLQQVVAQLNAVLGDSIQLENPAIGRCALSTTFENPSIAAALDVIAATFNLEIIRDEKHYTVKGNGCN